VVTLTQNKDFNCSIERELEVLVNTTQDITTDNIDNSKKELAFIDGKIEAHLLTSQLYLGLLKEEIQTIDNLLRCRILFYDSKFKTAFKVKGVSK
jgi:hypothetical protein